MQRPINIFLIVLCLAPAAFAQPRPASPPGRVSPEELQRLEARVAEILPRLMEATVAIRVLPGEGSGVIVSPDGLVLTAGHVSGTPDREVMVVLPDGRSVKGKTLGRNKSDDDGMVQLLEPGPFPYVEVGDSAALQRGQWVLALGHSNGYRRDRPAPLRVGRVNRVSDFIVTDAVLVGGDSGGPLFDLDGRVVGIHSRIGNSAAANMHVPIKKFSESWDRLVAGDEWSNFGDGLAHALRGGPWMGIECETDAGGVRVTLVEQGSPAAESGLRAGDVITRINGRDIDEIDDLRTTLRRFAVGDTVRVTLTRDDGDITTVPLKLGRTPPPEPGVEAPAGEPGDRTTPPGKSPDTRDRRRR
jgi:serine protease Do